MSVKKVLPLIVLISLLSINSQAEKKQPPLTMAELQNPKGPSYVPIPYPQTREEIIEDFIYIIKNKYLPNRTNRYYGKTSLGRKIFPELLKDDSGLVFGDVITVTNKTNFRGDKFFLLDIFDSSKDIIARICLEESGLFASARYASKGFNIPPLLSISRVKDIFSSSSLSVLNKAKVEHIEYEVYKYCSLTSPFLQIKTKNDVFYMDPRNRTYKIKKKEEFSSLRSITLSCLNKYHIANNKESLDIPLINTFSNEIIYLKEIK